MTGPVQLRLSALVLVGAGAIALSTAPSQAYSALYVFGDSLSDVGNVYTATQGTLPASPYYDGRFSNGPVWVETLSAKLGLGPVTPALQKGNDFAFGYATASNAVPNPDPSITGIPNVQQQVGSYLATHGSKADPSALYAVWIGANDVLNALSGLATGTLTAQQASDDLAASVQAEVGALKTLVASGAEHLLVGLVPDIGLTPRLNTKPAAAATGTALAYSYNQQLLEDLKTEIPAGDVATFDTFTLLDKTVADPGAYGFKNVTDACFGGTFTSGGTACADPDDYLFWDTIHPTEAGHAAIADLAFKAVSPVPLPASAALFGTALVVLGAFAAFRRHAAKAA